MKLSILTALTFLIVSANAFADMIYVPNETDTCREVATKAPEKDGYSRDMRFGSYEGLAGDRVQFGFALIKEDGTSAKKMAMVTTDLECNILGITYTNLK